jgi:hypothetical protein
VLKSISSRKLRNGGFLAAVRKAEILEKATRIEIVKAFADFNAEYRFVPYIEMHEFEAMLFSNVHMLAEIAEIDVMELEKIIEAFNSPEEINDDPNNAPSKRIQTLKKGYRKVAMGKTVSEAIGVKTIRKQCPHFNNWLTMLEHLTRGTPKEA